MLDTLALTQPQMDSRLSSELSSGTLPQSLLFWGRPYSSRMTAAISLSAALMGLSFDQALSSPDLVAVTDRDHAVRLKAASGILLKNRNQAALKHLRREAQVLLLQYREALWTNQEKDAFAAASELSELLDKTPDLDSQKDTESFCSSFDAALDKLLSRSKRSSGFSIDQLRAIQTSLNQDSSSAKCVILENIELVTVGAMNSALKLLEEPPAGARLILVSKNARRILPTILSRVRSYEFPPVPASLQDSLLRNLFHTTREWNSIEDYYFSMAGLDLDRLGAWAEDWVRRTSVERRLFEPSEMTQLCSFLERFACQPLFLEKCVAILEDGMAKGVIAPAEAARTLAIYNRANSDAQTYNTNRRSMLDSIQREVVSGWR